MLSMKLEDSAVAARFKPTQLDGNREYDVVDLESRQAVSALGKDIDSELLSAITGNKNSWIVEIRPKQAGL